MPNTIIVDVIDIDDDGNITTSTGSAIMGSTGIIGSTVTNSAPNFNRAGTTTPSPNYTFTVNAPYGTPALTMMDPISTNPKLPAVVFASHCDAGIPITMTLEPESSISQWEVLQLTLMLHAAMAGATFGAFQFVAKSQLERHFKYAR